MRGGGFFKAPGGGGGKKAVSTVNSKMVDECEYKFKILTWNIPDSGNIKKCWEFLRRCDLLCFQETWLESHKEIKVPNYLDRNYIWKCKSAER